MWCFTEHLQAIASDESIIISMCLEKHLGINARCMIEQATIFLLKTAEIWIVVQLYYLMEQQGLVCIHWNNSQV